MMRTASIVVALALAGCATVPSQQRAEICQNTDWVQFGENDGVLGVPLSERADRFLDCSEVGQPVDLAAYNSGREKGLQTYCTTESGLQVGLDGREYRNVCPPELETAFLQGLSEGRAAAPVAVGYRGGKFVKGGFFGPRFFFGSRGFRRGFRGFRGSRFRGRGFRGRSFRGGRGRGRR